MFNCKYIYLQLFGVVLTQKFNKFIHYVTKRNTIMTRNIISLLAFALLLSACSTPKTLQATGGSKADATVDLSYSYGIFEEPVIDWSLALVTAKERCKAWDYKNAESFGGQKNTCQAFNGYGDCVNTLVTITYQCMNR
jgi:hypothetical protein